MTLTPTQEKVKALERVLRLAHVAADELRTWGCDGWENPQGAMQEAAIISKKLRAALAALSALEGKEGG